MTRCDEYRAQLLDYQYGLLEPAEAAAVEDHLAGCPDCPAALAAVAKEEALFARAARLSFPGVRFEPPADVPTTPTARPAARPPRWAGWVVAAALLAAAFLFGTPVARDWAGYREKGRAADQSVALLTRAEAAEKEAAAGAKAAVADAEKKAAAARGKHDAAVARWVAHDIREQAGRELTLIVSGPAAAVPGAPNEYAVEVLGPGRQPVPAEITAAVRDAADEKRVYYSTSFTWGPGAADRRTIRLPADLWAKVPAGAAELVLAVSARDPKTGARADLAEPIRLRAAVFTTFLVTDKPLYRPGEPVFFRSLTLDRTTFRPPARDLTLRYEIVPAAGGAPVASAVGRAEPVRAGADGQFEPVPGPDGKPVRGVGCGVFRLADNLSGGQYVLNVYEVPPDHPADKPPPAGAAVLAARKLTVLKYTPERLLKTLDFDARTYGPGDTVRAKLTVRDQGKPAANATILVTADVNGTPVPRIDAPLLTDADGTARITFRLPAADAASAVLTVQVLDPVPDTIVRPVPLAPRSLAVEFFPEGGDLVAGVPGRVYFRATTPAGKPADVEGYLTDGTRSIAPVKTLTDPDRPGANQGTGVFAFTPEPGKRYALKLLRPTTAAQAVDVKAAALLGGFAAVATGVYPLPRALANGVGLSIPEGVTAPGQPIRARVWSNDRRDVYVGAYTRGVAVAAARATVEPGRPAEVVLAPTAEIGGVTRVTVFEEPDPARGRQDLTPVAERLVYRRPARTLDLGFTPDRPAYAPGDAVSLAISARTEAGEPAPAILWAAVVNQSVLTMADDRAERQLPAHFLLAGEVRHPDELEYADFFLTDHPKAAESLDLLLGTQGWRRFAEQAPGRFRSSAPAGEEGERDRFLVSAGVRPSYYPPAGSRNPAADELAPEYRTIAREYAAAATALRAAEAAAGEWEKTAAADVAAARAAAAATTREAREYAADLDARRGEVRVLAAAAVVAGVGILASRRVRRFGGRAAVVGGGGLILLAGLLAAADLDTRGPRDWPDVAPPDPPAGKTVTADPPPGAPADGRPLVESAGFSRPPRAGSLVRAAPVGDPRFRTPTDVPLGADVRTWLDNPVMPDGALGTAPFSFEQALERHKLTEGGKVTPEERTAARRVERKVVRHAPFVAREYAHTRTVKPAGDDTRTDFTETVLWQPLLVLPGDGKATVHFQLSDSVQAYRVLVAGHTLDGRLGATAGLIEVRKPLALDVKLPAEVTAGDRIDLPVVAANGTASARNVEFGIWSDHLKWDESRGGGTVPVAARGAAGATIPLTVPAGVPVAKVRVSGKAGPGLTDAVERTVSVAPDGFPAGGAVGGVLEKTAAATLTLPDQIVPGSLAARVVVYTNPAAEAKAGLDGLLREPHGCFEQASTANYPNVLVLDYLREIGKHPPAVAENARGLLERGYSRLAGFEVEKPGGGGREGFEWFGHYPPHGPLSAYGLMQFADMARVYPVDPGLLARTRDFLLARRDGAGGFARPAVGHAFGDAPPAVADAYTVWAITEAERGAAARSDLARELAAAAKAAAGAGDPYLLALVANARLNRGEPAPAELAALVGKQRPDGSVPGAATTITRSHGPDAVTETTALAALAWLKAPPAFAANARRAVGYLYTCRGAFGAFGATQATVLALKALAEHARRSPKAAGAGRVAVRVGGAEVAAAAFGPDATDPVTVPVPDPDRLFRPGPNRVEVTCSGAEAYPFTVAWEASTRKPAGDPACAVRLSANLDREEAVAGRTVCLAVRVENATADGQGMAVAAVGLPAGLKLPPDVKQLRDLVEAGTVAYWEAIGRDLVFYWRGLAPKQAIAFTLDLIADVPGEYRGPAGRAYLYNHPHAKAWADPLAIRIRPSSP